MVMLRLLLGWLASWVLSESNTLESSLSGGKRGLRNCIVVGVIGPLSARVLEGIMAGRGIMRRPGRGSWSSEGMSLQVRRDQ